jgi:transposase-like protein
MEEYPLNFFNEELTFTLDNTVESFNPEEFQKNISINVEYQCPRCKGQSINRNGKTKLNRQRYLCKDCGKSFSDTTGSPLSYSKKSGDKWISYIYCMKNRLSIRESAKILKISLATSFHWRHKILSVIGTKVIDKKLSETIEVHELKIRESFKGAHKKASNGLKLYKSAEEYKSVYHGEPMAYDKYELLSDKNRRRVVSILSCKDSKENTCFKAVAMGRVTRQILDKVLAPIIRNGKVLSTSSNINYVKFAKSNKMKLSMKGSHTYGIKGIDNKRAQDQARDFKKFLKIFRGVASKYISYYINWFKVWVENSENTSLTLLKNFITGKRQLRVFEFKWVQFDGKLAIEGTLSGSSIL